MQYEVEAAPAGGYAKRLAAGLSALDGLVRKSPDAAARIVIVAVALVLAWHSWARWGNFQIDWGRDLYVSVEIMKGRLLYRDIWFPYGPLPPYFGYLLVYVFGAHFTTFYLWGIAITILTALTIFTIGSLLKERTAAMAAAMLVLFQGFEPSLFSYVCPYTYAGPLAALFSLLSVWFAIKYVLDRTGGDFAIAGLAAGLAMLCKPEFGASCYVMLAFVILEETMIQRSSRAPVRAVLECIPGVTLWVAIYGWFFWKLTPGFILFDNWLFTPGSYFMRTYGIPYTRALGLRFVPSEVILLILDGTIALLLWYGIAKVRAKYVGRWLFTATVFMLAVGLASARRFAFVRFVAIPVWAFLVFPPGMFFVGVGFLVFALCRLRWHISESRIRAEAVVALLAVTLAARVLAQVEPVGFGIYYDIPLFLIFAIVLGRCARLALSATPKERRRETVNSLLAAETVFLASILVPFTNINSARLETNWGAMYLEPSETRVARQLLKFIAEQKRRGRRVVALPEGHMIYALTDSEAPGRWETLIPGVLSPSQEEEFIADLRRARPEYILITNRKTSEYGPAYFGIDYDRKIYEWIETNYRTVGEFGHFRRYGNGSLAALIYELREPAPPK